MKKRLYIVGIVLSALLGVASAMALGNTRILGPVLIAISLYLLIGCVIKLCSMNEKWKNTAFCAIDLLWWLP